MAPQTLDGDLSLPYSRLTTRLLLVRRDPGRGEIQLRQVGPFIWLTISPCLGEYWKKAGILGSWDSASRAYKCSLSGMMTSSSGRSVGKIIANRLQENNQLIKILKERGTPVDFNETLVPDFQVGARACVLFLELRYHLLYNNYIHRRIGDLGRSFELRVLLALVDIQDNEATLRELNRIALRNDMTLMLAFSYKEAAGYVETLKCYEGKSASSIKPRVDSGDPTAQVTDCLRSIQSINKTDVITLATTFGTLSEVVTASREDLTRCPGMGDIKVSCLLEAFQAPFHQQVVDPPNADQALLQQPEIGQAAGVDSDDDDTDSSGGEYG
jgi:DNA excision repair protein ERCC-1